MRGRLKIIIKLSLGWVVTLSACEKVVIVNLETAAPRLVVEANIKWVKGTSGNVQKIRLSKTIAYYDSQSAPVNNAEDVTIKNNEGRIFNFVAANNEGEYVCVDFVPRLGEKYELNIIYEGKIYAASEQLMDCPGISEVNQDNNGGFTKDQMEVIMFYKDSPVMENQYMITFNNPYKTIPIISVAEDKFYSGVQMSASIIEEQLKKGDKVNVHLEGISKPYYNYMRLMLQNAAGANPFQAVAANAKGNIYNKGLVSEYALGYFRLSESDVIEYIIK